jgi:hypothetical protein
MLWKSVINCLKHNSTKVKRAALYCTKNIIQNNKLQLQFIVENNLTGLLSSILTYQDLGIKIEASYTIYTLAEQGYRHVSNINLPV